MRIVWQTGATSEHQIRRSVQGYAECADTEVLERRVRALNGAGLQDSEIATALNAEGLRTAHGAPLSGGTIHLLRKRWKIRTVKINGVEPNPERWPDGSYSVQGAAIALGVTDQTVFKWLRKGRLVGHQRTKGQPWQIILPEERVAALAGQVRCTNPSRREAS
ncbi:hypothetical protein [Paracraurococcus lichenis]|uniref:Helix-turn-helix domain-containing protein n=1 Tax=Paracraurococcus lichenis TaxID=3064888 RepID=A0ABT9EEM0_9PROT|nr:hypothetical protein [Paracraurococcus sp. LOR1-02]MDO9714658.1 hypothetical protein [Paracraurococcus sp. LOR1-02]